MSWLPREELQKRLWSEDTFVDFDNSLNTAIARLRVVLGDSARHPLFIETVPRQGYRFVAPVEKATAPREVQQRRIPVAWAIATIVAVVVGAIALWQFRTIEEEGSHPLREIPLTAFAGLESEPTFSPSGDAVAFIWNGPDLNNFDIYVKFIGPSQPIRLTSHPAVDFSPAWSPDGRHIVFLRDPHAARITVVRVPAPAGGAEEEIGSVFGPMPRWEARGGPLVAWTPSGDGLVVSDREEGQETRGLYLLPLNTPKETSLDGPAAGCLWRFRADLLAGPPVAGVYENAYGRSSRPAHRCRP